MGIMLWKRTVSLNKFHPTDLFLKPLKSSEKLWFCNVFRGYRKRPEAGNGFMHQLFHNLKFHAFHI